MDSFSLIRMVRRLPIISLVLLVAGLLLAGCGSSGGNINSVSATVGFLNASRGLAVDSAQNIFIADAGNHVIREFTNSTGLLTSAVGTLNSNGYSGDGGAATSAQLNFPQGVAVDSSGNLYIADTGNNVIRKVSGGNITTLAGSQVLGPGYTGDGGAATSAQLNGPLAVALDSSGNLYIADTGNNVIRKIVLSTGVITTVAGNHTPGYSGDGGAATSATLNSPADVAVDSSGNLFIADRGNFVIREVSAGNIATVAGNNTSGYSGNGGAATSAQLNNPQGVAVDSSGNLYIADTGNNVVRKVSGSTISTVAGNGTAGYTGDGGSATGAEFLVPNALTFGPSGVLYIDDAGNRAVRTVRF